MENNTISQRIPKEHKIRTELRRALFGDKMFCPHCGSPQVKKYGNRYRCKLCRKPFSLTSVSWLKGMKLPLQVFWLVLWCWTNKAPIDQAKNTCGLSELTIRRWYKKFRDHLPKEPFDNLRLSGTVQMDEAYRGGKKKGYAIIGAKQVANRGKPSKMALQVIDKPSVNRNEVLNLMIQTIKPGSQFNTDGAAIYKGIENWWPVIHNYDIHSKFEFSQTSEIEGLWGNLFTFIRRMYHHTTKQNIAGMVHEFSARAMFPSWFDDPDNYIRVSIAKVYRPIRKEWRGQYQSKKKVKNFFQLQNDTLPFTLKADVLVSVPS